MTSQYLSKSAFTRRLIKVLKRRKPLWDQARSKAGQKPYDVYSGADLADFLNKGRNGVPIPAVTAQKWLNREAIPSPANLQVLSKKLCVSSDLLLFGMRQRTDDEFDKEFGEVFDEIDKPLPNEPHQGDTRTEIDRLPSAVRREMERVARSINLAFDGVPKARRPD